MLKVSIIGYLGQDAQLKTFNNVNYVSFSVAHTEKWKDSKTGNDIEKTQWVSCLKRIGDSDKLVQLMKKGSKVYVEGSLSAKTFDNKGVVEVALNCNVTYLDVTPKESVSQPQVQPQFQSSSNESFFPADVGHGSGFGKTIPPSDSNDLPF